MKLTTHKYGVGIPRSAEESYALGSKNVNTLWRDILNREMSNLQVVFNILDTNCNPPPGWLKASGNIIFDVIMTLKKKSRWVKDGHRTPEPENLNYACVFSQENVRMALTFPAINGLDVCACDINAYPQIRSSEKHFIIYGPEFGLKNIRKKALITRALYWGKRAGSD